MPKITENEIRKGVRFESLCSRGYTARVYEVVNVGSRTADVRLVGDEHRAGSVRIHKTSLLKSISRLVRGDTA